MPHKREVCECCDVSMFELVALPLEKRIEGTDNLGVKNILQSDTIEDLDENGKYVIEWCVDFLLFKRLNDDIHFLKKNVENNDPYKYKYITLWSFIYNFLNIQKDTGYDYYVMSWLDWNKICEHGSGIRCAWFESHDERNPYRNRILTEERKNIIIEWATNAPDDI